MLRNSTNALNVEVTTQNVKQLKYSGTANGSRFNTNILIALCNADIEIRQKFTLLLNIAPKNGNITFWNSQSTNRPNIINLLVMYRLVANSPFNLYIVWKVHKVLTSTGIPTYSTIKPDWPKIADELFCMSWKWNTKLICPK